MILEKIGKTNYKGSNDLDFANYIINLISDYVSFSYDHSCLDSKLEITSLCGPKRSRLKNGEWLIHWLLIQFKSIILEECFKIINIHKHDEFYNRIFICYQYSSEWEGNEDDYIVKLDIKLEKKIHFIFSQLKTLKQADNLIRGIFIIKKSN